MPRIQYGTQTVFGMRTAAAIAKVIEAKAEIEQIINAGMAAGVVPGSNYAAIEMPATPDFGLQAGQGDAYWNMLGSVNTTLGNVADSWLASLDMGG